MRKIKVQFTCNWCSDDSIFERFNKCYHMPHDSIFELVKDYTYNYLVIFNADTNHVYKSNINYKNKIGIVGEPMWAGKKYIDYLQQHCQHILYHSQVNDQIVYYPGLLPNHFDLDNTDASYCFDRLLVEPPIKTKKCSMIVSNTPDTLRPAPNTLYHKRKQFAEMILKTDLDVDIYGKGWSVGSDSRIKGEIVDKRDGLRDYEFSIAIENCVENGYFTEKLTDCIMLNTTPIYHGCPNIEMFFSDIVNLQSLDTVDEIYEILSTPAKQQQHNKLKLKNKFNLFVALNKYLKHLTKHE